MRRILTALERVAIWHEAATDDYRYPGEYWDHAEDNGVTIPGRLKRPMASWWDSLDSQQQNAYMQHENPGQAFSDFVSTQDPEEVQRAQELDREFAQERSDHEEKELQELVDREHRNEAAELQKFIEQSLGVTWNPDAERNDPRGDLDVDVDSGDPRIWDTPNPDWHTFPYTPEVERATDPPPQFYLDPEQRGNWHPPKAAPDDIVPMKSEGYMDGPYGYQDFGDIGTMFKEAPEWEPEETPSIPGSSGQAVAGVGACDENPHSPRTSGNLMSDYHERLFPNNTRRTWRDLPIPNGREERAR